MYINCRAIRFLLPILLLLMLCPTGVAKTIYVDDDTIGANDGTSWADAYMFLQEALADARFAEKSVEIRVAQGTYRPSEGLMAIPEFDWRTTTFELINGVTLKGGYAGFNEPDPNARDVHVYETVLSGDLAGNDIDVNDPEDLYNEPTRAENSYHVVTGSGTGETAVLDGFAITGGDGAGMYIDSGSPIVTDCTFSANWSGQGAGMYNYSGSPILTHCTFSGNSGIWGTGMYNYEGNPTLIDCTFSENCGAWGGGGMYSEGGSPTLTNCSFIGNIALGGFSGGGMYNERSDPTLTNCTFIENSSHMGGGMHNSESSPTLIGCMFSGNYASRGGGGMHNIHSNLQLTDCTFSGNSAHQSGGGMSNSASHTTLTNCTFRGNYANGDGGGMVNGVSHLTLTNCTFTRNSARRGNALACHSYGQNPSNIDLINCILWDNDSEIWKGAGSTINIAYSNVQGGWPGVGNIDVDPLFVDPENGDYHLKSEAGRWNPVSEIWVVDDVTSPCIDAGDPNSPVAFEPFPNGGIVNMGVFGGTTQASKSPSGLHTKYGGGEGKLDNPYLIYTPEQMNTIGLHAEDRDCHFKLMADIDLGGLGMRDFNIIGTFPNFFRGVFDGNGHTISNFTYISTDVDGVALFSCIEGTQAEIRNLGLIDPVVDAGIVNPIFEEDRVEGNRAGSLVDYLWRGTVNRCYVRGGSVSADIHIGGLVAYNQGGTIADCSSTADVAGFGDIGGLVGYNGGTIVSCHAISTVTGNDAVGGLAGFNDGMVQDSSAKGSVVGDTDVGGLVGENKRHKTIQGSFSMGSVTGIDSVGGLVGTSHGDINNCYATSKVSGGRCVGGLVGFFGSAIIDRCYSTGNIVHEPIEGFADNPRIGGLVGSGYPPEDEYSLPSEILRSFWDIETSGQTMSFGGMGLTTAEMQTAQMFIEVGWDFVDETDNGTDDIWWITEGQDYPRLWWELATEN
ncbi:right-handed parallel beta-helix repeat-containing protein [Planctomycetota bacterium]